MAAGIELRRFASTAELVDAAAAEWIRALLEHGPAATTSAALPGGRLARSFLEACTRHAQPHRTRLPRIDLFWADERCVPPSHPDSNFRLAQESFILPLAIAAARVHRTIGELDPCRAAELLEAELRANLTPGADGVPVIDWVFLGMGEDGHIASLFPGQPADLSLPAPLVLPVISPKPPPHRVTMGYRLLGAATEARILISGSGKEAPLQQSLTTTQLPLGVLLARRSRTVVLHDFALYPTTERNVSN